MEIVYIICSLLRHTRSFWRLIRSAVDYRRDLRNKRVYFASLSRGFAHFVHKMMRIPRGISPASRGAVSGLSCPQNKMFSAVRTDLFNTGLSSPPMNSVPAGYFTPIGNTTAADQRPNCLYATPHGPEPKPVRTSSGRLPVSLFPSTATNVTLCMHMLDVSCLST